MEPDVTVLMPVYNGERHLRAAIDSILSQTHHNFELVIVDDGSSDGSAGIVSSYRDARIRAVGLGQNVGLANALNEGLRHARAALIARQDQDDLAEPRRLERQLKFLKERPEVALVGSQGMAISEAGVATGIVRRPVGRDSIRWFSLFDNPFIHTSVVFRASIVREVGGYDHAYDPFSQDYDLWGRVMQDHVVANLDESLVRYRVSDSSVIGAMRTDARDSDKQRRFDAILRELTLRQARRVLGEAAVTDEDGSLLAGLVRGLAGDQVPAFLALFERLLEIFTQRFDRAGSPDFGRTLARQFDAVAFRVAPPSRRVLFSIYAHVARVHPEVLAHVSWPRTAAMLLFGKSGRERLGHWWRT
ncbi:MAG: glycosyltransferase [Vicinamibacterales bacterium]